MEKEFTLGTREFKLAKLDPFKQFHIVRRLGPILADLLPALSEIKKLGASAESNQLEAVAKFAEPIMNGLSKLSDVDADLVLFGLLQAVEMKQIQGNWAKVASNSMLMIQDLELPILLNLAGRAFVFNLSDFFAALPQ